MDNSQSSDVFSEAEEHPSRFAPNILELYFPYILAEQMSGFIYNTFFHDTKILLSRNVKQEVLKTSFSSDFVTVLDNSRECISQSLDQVFVLMSKLEVDIPQLCEYLDNSVTILQLLSGYINSIVESALMTCENMRTFPTDTGKILMTVFSHCKDSESVYGNHIKSVEKQLKNLFRNCHELQLTYLMILEKNFVFDISEKDQLSVLVEALDINLKIGEIVQTLDVKTMAEQWKGYTLICEKYADSFKDQHIFENSSKILCKMIENNIKTSLMIEQHEKMVLRSMKIANFTIKILMKVCNIFRLSTGKNFKNIMDLLIYINLNNPYCCKPTEEKSPQLLDLIKNHIFAPTEVLLKELLLHENFVDGLQNLQTFDAKDEESLSYILLVIAITKYIIEGNEAKSYKKRVIEYIFNWLPFGHIWFNIGLKFKSNKMKTVGLYEHLLIHTFSLALTLDCEEMSYLEQKMYESTLGTDCYKALFTANLWELLAKSCQRQFLFTQILSFCKIYQKLENNKTFLRSPQKVHLSHVMNRLLKRSRVDDVIKLCKIFDPNEEKNISLWTALRIDCLPFEDESRVYNENKAEEAAIEKLVQKLNSVFDSTAAVKLEDIEVLVKLMKLIATGNCVAFNQGLQNCVLKAWSYVCLRSKQIPIGPLAQESSWFVEYIEALVTLTVANRYIFLHNANVVKVLHVVDNLIEKGNLELKLIFINLLFNTSRYLVDDESKYFAEKLHEKIFRKLLFDTKIVRNKFFNEIRKQRIPFVEKTITAISKEDDLSRESWKHFQTNGTLKDLDVKDQICSTFGLSFGHKCLENETIVLEDSEKNSKSNSSASNNFDFVDMDTLFETESDSEPASKRVKLNDNEAEEILIRIENEVSLLCNVKENFSRECRVRIREVCEKLLNIID